MNIEYKSNFRILKLFFLIICILILAEDIAAKGNTDDKFLVILTFDTTAPNQCCSETELMFALEQYLDYLLSTKSVTFEITRAKNSALLDSILSQPSNAQWNSILMIQASGKSISQRIFKKSSFSRRAFTLQDRRTAIKLHAVSYELNDNRYRIVKQKSIEEKSSGDWFEFNPDEEQSTKQDKLNGLTEPIEYILQRAVKKITDEIPDGNKTSPKSGETISATVYVDSSFIKSSSGNWETKFQRMISHTSKSLFEQFGYELLPKSMNLVDLQSDTDYTMSALFRAVKRSDLPADNRLSILLLNKNDRVQYFTSGRYDKVGLAEIGKNQIIVNELPSPEKRQTDWQPLQNSLILIHEIGHTLGAIHVSDSYSVMNSSLNWLASDKFDPFNKKIIKDALSGKLLFNNKTKYLSYLADLLLTTDYHLVDIPFMFYTFVNGSDRSPLFRKLNENKEYKPFILAASGYGYMQNNYREKAADDFRQAIQYLPMEASLYYYLSLVTEGEESARALEKAATAGYWEAQQKQQSISVISR